MDSQPTQEVSLIELAQVELEKDLKQARVHGIKVALLKKLKHEEEINYLEEKIRRIEDGGLDQELMGTNGPF